MAKWTQKSNVIDNLLEMIDSGVNTLSLLSTQSVNSKLNSYDAEFTIHELISYMKSSGLINKNQPFTLTSKARKRLQLRSIERSNQSEPETWDSKWRIVMFEIPEKQKTQRDAFASKLQALGFVHLHRGVLICPFDKLESVAKLAEYYSIEDKISMFTTDNISSTKFDNLKQKFKLK